MKYVMYLNAAHKEIAQTNSHLLWLSHLKPVTGKNLTFVMQYVIKKPVILESEMLHFQVHFNSGDNMSIFILC